MEVKHSRLVGIDYGRARLGLSVSDITQKIALPIAKAIRVSPQLFQDLEKALASFMPLEGFVLGLPLLLNGSEGEMAQEVRAFGNRLSQHFQLPCLYWDERLSSTQADRVLQEDKLSRKKRASHIDSVAATLILQSYLEKKNFDSLRLE